MKRETPSKEKRRKSPPPPSLLDGGGWDDVADLITQHLHKTPPLQEKRLPNETSNPCEANRTPTSWRPSLATHPSLEGNSRSFHGVLGPSQKKLCSGNGRKSWRLHVVCSLFLLATLRVRLRKGVLFLSVFKGAWNMNPQMALFF